MINKRLDRITYISVIVLAALLFILIYGIHVLNPFYDDWLLERTDLTQHYLGWCFYRRSKWTFPLGLTNQLAYPTYTSVVFTDSIPILALFFKVLSPMLPQSFQYFGWWGIVCFMLQGYFAVKILREFSVGRVESVVGSILFILSPIVIERMFRHTALGGHWIILASIYLFVLHRKLMYKDTFKSVVCWGIIGGLIPLIHLYYLPMCGIFLGGYILCSFIKEKKFKFIYILPGIAFSVCLLGITYILGGFTSHMSYTDAGLGEFSFNLNGFFNAKGYSGIFEALPTYADGQYEGFAYLGLGIFILLLLTLIYLFIDIRNIKKANKDIWIYGTMYVLMSLGLIIFAASPLVTYNDKLLFVLTDSSRLSDLWSIFRSTGRIVWPVCYLIYIGVIVCNDRLWKNSVHKEYFAVISVAICCAVQIFDISNKIIEQNEYFAHKRIYESVMKSEIWNTAVEQGELEHIVLGSGNYEHNEILQIAKYAYDNNLTMNIFYFARPISVRENTQKSLDNLDNTCLYIFKGDEAEALERYDLNYCEADGYVVGTTFPLK